jgi:hypothetical protein
MGKMTRFTKFSRLVLLSLLLFSQAHAEESLVVNKTLQEAITAKTASLGEPKGFLTTQDGSMFPLFNDEAGKLHTFRAIVVDRATDQVIARVGFESGWARMGATVPAGKSSTELAPDAPVEQRVVEFVGVVPVSGDAKYYPVNANVVGTSQEPFFIVHTAIGTAGALAKNPGTFLAIWELALDTAKYQIIDVSQYFRQHELTAKFPTVGEEDIGGSLAPETIVTEYRVCIDENHCPLADSAAR